MPTTRPLKVFLCHASADKPAVRKLYHYLRERKMDPWLDAEKLLPGQNWKTEIPKALLSSDVIIICLSKNSVDKEGYVQKEIRFALDKALEMPEGRIFLIPARLEECDLPESLSAYHYVNLFEADGYRRLLRSLRVRAEQIGATKVSLGEDTISLDTGKATHEKANQDAKENARLAAALDLLHDKIDLENAKKIAREKTEQDAREKLAREKAESDAAEKAKRETKVEPTVEKLFVTKLPSWGFGLIAFAVLALIVWGISSMQASPIATQTPSATQTLLVGQTMMGSDGMTLLYVPAGEFKMGSSDADPLAQSDEKPQHTVYLDAFWIDQTEVTNKQYAACLSAGACTLPSDTKSYTRSSYYGKPEFDDYPVIYVDWNKATAYCSWAGRRLPTEAEWEKAARGIDGHIYPWGSDAPTNALLNLSQNVGDTTEVGKYPSGASPYGALDMAGNVWEWVVDWYSETYYQSSPSSNPTGPASGQYRVLRGGTWYGVVNYVRSAFRLRNDPAISYFYLGFRCARDATP